MDDAEADLALAIAAHERMRAPIWLARTWLDLASVLRARGRAADRRRAADLVTHAAHVAEEHGAAAIARRAATMRIATRAALAD